MPAQPLTKEALQQAFDFVQEAVNDGFSLRGLPSAIAEGHRRFHRAGYKLSAKGFFHRYKEACRIFNKTPTIPIKQKVTPQPAPEPPADIQTTLRQYLKQPRTVADLTARTSLSVGQLLDQLDQMRDAGINVVRQGELFSLNPVQEAAWVSGPTIELVSRPDNTFCFGAFGDLHAGSKYTRWDVREDLIRRSERAKAQAIFDTGNWIDGAARFNAHDLVAHGLEAQCELLATKHPKTKLPIYAVAGDDHEGWIASREGVNVGRYCENIMRAAGHNWTDLGYMEAHVTLRNANTGKTASMAVVHPGGGSAYALSYSIQKIVESYEGGEKPNVGLYGHYHKIWAGIIRNIWCVQTGCQQDQTPFMRKKRLEAHVGGTIITLEQDPKSGAIVGMVPQLLRYFNEGFYTDNRWSRHGSVNQPPRSPNAIAA